MAHLTRRRFVQAGTSAAVIAALGAPATFAQDGDKPTIKVGSKNFTEQFIMNEFLALKLEDAGYPVERNFGLGGTAVLMEAVFADQIDVFVEYTGTGLIAMLQQELPEIPEDSDTTMAEEVYRLTKEGYDQEYNLTWLEQMGWNNTYALAVTADFAEEHGLKTTSDLEPIAGDLNLGTDLEFQVRDDGLPGLVETYGFEFGDVTPGDPGLMYQAVAEGEVDVITAYTTDGRIPALDLVVLEDDKGFFPPYYAAPVVRNAILDENPEIGDLLNELADQFTDEEIQAANYEVDENGAEAQDVARAILEEKGLIGSDS
ncbi:MAG TPA: glycine betaine ABC transporter substrate-binding protein [Thermomicrobiales bacterium]|jgi:osmoprotectant transport system substrate-binding protein|nr:glycine betaine ABC transporter substrate-binding protein [Thermomicrobiales bacterium]